MDLVAAHPLEPSGNFLSNSMLNLNCRLSPTHLFSSLSGTIPVLLSLCSNHTGLCSVHLFRYFFFSFTVHFIQAFVLFLDCTFHSLHRAVFLPTDCPWVSTCGHPDLILIITSQGGLPGHSNPTTLERVILLCDGKFCVSVVGPWDN